MSTRTYVGMWQKMLCGAALAATLGLQAADGDKPAPAAADAVPAAEAAPRDSGINLAPTNTMSPTIRLTLDDVPLAEVVKLFTRVSGANIIAASTNLQGSVTANLQDVPWRPALESILQRQGLMLSENPPKSGVFVIEKLQEGQEPCESETVTLNYAKVDDVAKLLQNILGGVTSVVGSNGVTNVTNPEGVNSVVVTAFPAGNIIVIHAPIIKMIEARKIIESVDRPRTQVYIEAKFVELSDDASKKLGIDWQSLGGYNVVGGISFKNVNGKAQGLDAVSDSSINNHNGTGISVLKDDALKGPGGSTKLRNVTSTLTPDDLKIVLAALETTGGSKVIYNPKIMVANEQPALMKVAKDEPNIKITRTPSSVQGQADTTTTEMDATTPYFTYGITLDVTPRVNTSSNITVTIKPEISTHDSDKIVNGNSYPIIMKKTVQTTFSLADQHTAVIGGLIQSDNEDTDSKIPVLGSIPWIGPRFFGYKSHTQTKTELLIFVTVALVDAQTVTQATGVPVDAVLSRKDLPKDGM